MKKKPTKELQKLRQMAGLGQFEVHEKTGIERSRLSLIECGHVEARPEELSRIMGVIRAAHRRQVEEFERIAGSAEAA
ncbi:MAG: helix-turn-helix transcriptional regulator [Candidatus Sulfotelmatobacter sp.]